MRIAAGVLLIICAAFNGCAGSLYALGGAVAAGAGELGDEAAAELAAEMKKAAAENKAANGEEVVLTKEEISEGASEAKAVGGGLMFFGLFLFAMVGLQIAAAVMLFIKKSSKFVMVIAGLTILAEVIGIAITTMGITNIVGLATGALAFMAARAMGAQLRGSPPPQQVSAG